MIGIKSYVYGLEPLITYYLAKITLYQTWNIRYCNSWWLQRTFLDDNLKSMQQTYEKQSVHCDWLKSLWNETIVMTIWNQKFSIVLELNFSNFRDKTLLRSKAMQHLNSKINNFSEIHYLQSPHKIWADFINSCIYLLW